MISYKKFASGLGMVALLFTISCNKIKDFKDLNINPNVTTSPIPSALLTNVEAGIGGNLVFDAGGVNTGGGLYAQYFSETQYTEVSRYNKPTYNYDGYYAGSLEDLQNIIEYNTNPATAGAAAAYGSNKNQIAIARILKAHIIKMLTDAVGDLPYFTAFRANSGNTTPKYDPQEQIYADLIKELKEAVDQFDNGSAVQGDIIFNSNVAKWKKYANSLRMLLALNMIKVNPAAGKTEFLSAMSHPAGIITDNADNVVIAYPGGVYQHPTYNYYVTVQRLDYAVSKTMVDQLTSTNDARLNVFATSNVGFPFGLTRDNAVAFAGANNNWARILKLDPSSPNLSYQKQDAPLVVLGAAHIWLARAEAAQYGWTTEDKKTMYENGIRASFAQWGAGSADAYIASAPIGGIPDLKKIATQEWLAYYPSGLDGWNVYRRTNYPVLVPGPGVPTNPGVPRRTVYGTNDYSLNAANAAEAATRYTFNGSPDSQWGRIWWDK